MASEEFFFEKINDLDYEWLVVIAKVLDFKKQDIANKDTKFCPFKVIRKYLRSTETETPEGKAIFEKLENCFKNQIYQQQKMNCVKSENFTAPFNKNNFEHFEREEVPSKPEKIVYQWAVLKH